MTEVTKPSAVSHQHSARAWEPET